MKKFKRLFSGIVAFAMIFSVLQLAGIAKVYGENTEPTRIVLTQTEAKVCIEQGTLEIGASIYPDSAQGSSITWSSSNPAVAEPDQLGKVTLKAVGTATITAQLISDLNVIATCEVKVVPQVTAVNLETDTITLEKKDLAQTVLLKATVEPADAITDITYETTNWAVVGVMDGRAFPINAGEATIVARSASNPSISKEYKVIVLPKITGLSMDKPEITISRSKKQASRLIATAAPVGANDKVTYSSSDEAVAIVNSDGLVMPVAGGSAIITATSVSDANITATCNVTVTPAPTAVEIDKSEVTLSRIKSETAKLTAKVSPAETEQDVEYISSDLRVATVDANGVITPVSEGDATITVVSPYERSKFSTCKVKVVGTPSMLTLNKTEATVAKYKGETVQLAVEAVPVGSETDVVYSSSDETIATVDASGLVTPVAGGVVTITAKSIYDERIAANCTVTVIGDPTDVKLNKSKAVLDLGYEKSVTLTATVSEGSNPAVTYSSSNPKVAQVDDKGVVTGLSIGQATITVTTVDGDKKATCLVTVIDKEKMNPTITVDNKETTYKPVMVTVTAPTDYPGLDLIEYNIDGTGWQIYNGPVEVKVNGKFVAKTFDNFGNHSNYVEYEIKNIDSSKSLVLTGDVIDKDIFDKVKGVDITVEDTVKSAGVTLKWSFNGKDVKDTSKELDLKLNDVSKNKEVIENKYVNPLIISFVNHGELPAPMTIKILVDPSKFDVTKELNLYYYNETAEDGKKVELVKAELIPEKDADGNYYVSVVLTHHSDYFLSAGEKSTTIGGGTGNGGNGGNVVGGGTTTGANSGEVTTTTAGSSTLVQTGSPFDMKALLSLGLISVAVGVILIAKKRS